MPALTMVAAWMSAETGVGPSIASGSQTWSGNWALLPIAPMNSSRQMPIIIHGSISPLSSFSGSSLKTSVKLTVPIVVQMAMMPSAKPKSPTRLVMNAFLLARAAERLWYQKPMSRYEDRPTSSQAANTST